MWGASCPLVMCMQHSILKSQTRVCPQLTTLCQAAMPSLPSCATHPSLLSGGVHWEPQKLPAYELGVPFWNSVGMNSVRDQHNSGKPLASDYGACQKNLHGSNRTTYDAQPLRCTLLPFDPTHGCARRLFGRQALFVGDSTTAQLFVSVVMLLNGTVGRNSGWTTMEDMSGSACNDTLRLAFARSDTLWWTRDKAEVQTASVCSSQKVSRFAQRASQDADVIVLEIDHQHPAACMHIHTCTCTCIHASSIGIHMYMHAPGRYHQFPVAYLRWRACHKKHAISDRACMLTYRWSSSELASTRRLVRTESLNRHPCMYACMHMQTESSHRQTPMHAMRACVHACMHAGCTCVHHACVHACICMYMGAGPPMCQYPVLHTRVCE